MVRVCVREREREQDAVISRELVRHMVSSVCMCAYVQVCISVCDFYKYVNPVCVYLCMCVYFCMCVCV